METNERSRSKPPLVVSIKRFNGDVKSTPACDTIRAPFRLDARGKKTRFNRSLMICHSPNPQALTVQDMPVVQRTNLATPDIVQTQYLACWM